MANPDVSTLSKLRNISNGKIETQVWKKAYSVTQ